MSYKPGCDCGVCVKARKAKVKKKALAPKLTKAVVPKTMVRKVAQELGIWGMEFEDMGDFESGSNSVEVIGVTKTFYDDEDKEIKVSSSIEEPKDYNDDAETTDRLGQFKFNQLPDCCGVGVIGELELNNTDITYKQLFDLAVSYAKQSKIGYVMYTATTKMTAQIKAAEAAEFEELDIAFKNPKSNNTVIVFGRPTANARNLE